MKNLSIYKLQNEPGATATSSQFKDHTNPEYVGPGTWYMLTKKAYNADTRDKQLQFIQLMKTTCLEFPCKMCSGHCTEYIKNVPLEEYLGVYIEVNGKKQEIGMFIWIWKFHNVVNARLKKPLMSWDTAYNMYSETESLICSKTCDEASNFNEHIKPVKAMKVINK